MSMAGEYLPPLVTKLIGDNSDLLAAAAEAEAAMKGFAKTSTKANDEVGAGFRKSSKEIDDFTDLVVRRMRKGEDAVSVLRRELKRANDEVADIRKRMAKDAANQGLYADFKRAADELERIRGLAKKIAPDLLSSGREGGQGFFSGFMEGVSGIGAAIVPILIGALILASPAIGALIASAVSVGVGLGLIGIGAFIAAKVLPKVGYQFSKLGESLKKTITFGVSGAFDDALRTAVIYFQRYSVMWRKPLRGIFDELAPFTRTLAIALGDGLGKFIAQLQIVVGQISGAGGPLETFINTIPPVLESFGQFLVELTKDGPALARFISDAAYALTVFLVDTGKLISVLATVYNWSVELNEVFPFIGWSAQIEGLKILVLALGAFFVGLWDKIVSGAKAVGGWFANLGKAIWAWLKDAGAAIAAWFTNTVAWFKALPGRIVGFLASMPGRVTAVVKRMAHQAAYWVGWLVGRWFRFITEAPGKIVAGVAQAWAWIQTKFAEGVHNTIEFVRALPGAISTLFAYLWSAVTGWVSRTWASVVDWFGRTKTAMINAVVNGIDAVIGWFRTLPSRASEQGKAFKDRLIGFFSGAKDWLVEAGKDIVRGVVKGITDAWDWAVGKVKSFGGDLAKGFKDSIISHSPSELFARSGETIPAGVAVGVKRKTWMAVDAVSDMFGRTTPGLAYAGSGGGVSPVMASTMTSGPAAAAYRGPNMVYTEVSVDGQTIVRAMTPAAQRRKARSGATGLG